MCSREVTSLIKNDFQRFVYFNLTNEPVCHLRKLIEFIEQAANRDMSKHIADSDINKTVVRKSCRVLIVTANCNIFLIPNISP